VAESNPHLLKAPSGVELVQLLNELMRIRPLEPDYDDVSFRYQTDGRWRARYRSVLRSRREALKLGLSLAEDIDGNHEGPGYLTLVEALRSAIQEYRSHPTHNS
jgi:hypothetical protein